jgi:hypothetical protein
VAPAVGARPRAENGQRTQRVDRRGLDHSLGPPRQLGFQGDGRVRLELGQCVLTDTTACEVVAIDAGTIV